MFQLVVKNREGVESFGATKFEHVYIAKDAAMMTIDGNNDIIEVRVVGRGSVWFEVKDYTK